ncbi:MAG: RNA polymerase sigma factor [Planctomycetota bacterium]
MPPVCSCRRPRPAGAAHKPCRCNTRFQSGPPRQPTADDDHADTHADHPLDQAMQRHGGLVQAVLRDRLGDPDLVEEAFQQVFIAYWRHAADIRHPTSWLYACAGRMAVRLVRDTSRRRRYEATAGEVHMVRMQEAVVEGDADLADVGGVLHDCLGQLPPHQRETVLAHVVERESMSAIARRERCSHTAWHILWEEFCRPPWGIGNSARLAFNRGMQADADGGLDFLLADNRGVSGCVAVQLRPPGYCNQGAATSRLDELALMPEVVELVGAGDPQVVQVEEIRRPIGDRGVESFRVDVSDRAQFALTDGGSQRVVTLEGSEIVAKNSGFARVTVSYGTSFTKVVMVLVRDAVPQPVSLHFELPALKLTRIGDYVSLGLFARLENGDTVLVSAQAEVHSDDDRIVAVVDGATRARAAGSTRLRASWRGLEASLPVQVGGGPVPLGLAAEPDPLALRVGDRLGVRVSLLFDDDSRLDVGAAAG